MTDNRTKLTDDECWALLESQPVGRLATAVGGEADIFPVNFAVSERALLINTTPGSKLAEVAVNRRVAFEVDEVGPGGAQSVVVKGAAEILYARADLERARATGLVTYTANDKDEWIQITPTEISGFRLVWG